MIEENVKETKKLHIWPSVDIFYMQVANTNELAAAWMNTRLGVINLQEASAPFVTSEGSDFKDISCRTLWTEHLIKRSSAS